MEGEERHNKKEGPYLATLSITEDGIASPELTFHVPHRGIPTWQELWRSWCGESAEYKLQTRRNVRGCKKSNSVSWQKDGGCTCCLREKAVGSEKSNGKRQEVENGHRQIMAAFWLRSKTASWKASIHWKWGLLSSARATEVFGDGQKREVVSAAHSQGEHQHKVFNIGWRSYQDSTMATIKKKMFLYSYFLLSDKRVWS